MNQKQKLLNVHKPRPSRLGRDVIGNLFTMRGRRNRTSFFLLVFSANVLLYSSYILSGSLGIDIGFFAIASFIKDLLNASWFDFVPYFFLLMIIGLLVVLRVYLCVVVQRWHDIGLHGFFTVFLFFPYVNIMALLFLILWPGNKKRNRYGAPPKTLQLINESTE